MEMIHSFIPIYAILVSLLATVPIYFSRNKPNLREFWTILAAVLKFILILTLLPPILKGATVGVNFFEIVPGISLSFKVDPLGLFFALTASFLWIITSFYSIGYVRSHNEHKQTRFFICFAGSLSATIGAAFSANLFTMYIFYEALTLFTYPLIAHEETSEAFRGAKIYLVYLLGTSIAFLLPAIIGTYLAAGSLEFVNGGLLAATASEGLSSTFLVVLFALFILGIAKAAIMPLHSWLPNAMVAPTPVSALLHAVAVVKMGVFVILRVVLDVFGLGLLSSLGIGTFLAYFASFTIILGSIIALRQDNIKARLAYSTISQLSYIVVGVSLLSVSGVKGSILHILVHAFSKITLFFWAGAIAVGAHKKYVSQLSGIAKKMPVSMAIFTVGALSLIGLPPLGGFLSKWLLIKGSLESGMVPIAFVFMISSFLNACYFLPIIYKAYFEDMSETDQNDSHIREAPKIMLIPMGLTAFMTVVIFFFPGFFISLINIAVNGLF